MNKPTKLYHCTTARKMRLYKNTGCILKPVRGFDTLEAAMYWCIKTGRNMIVEIDLFDINPDNIHKMPDHHNQFGFAWWIDENISYDKLKVVLYVEQDKHAKSLSDSVDELRDCINELKSKIEHLEREIEMIKHAHSCI